LAPQKSTYTHIKIHITICACTKYSWQD